MLIYNVLFKGVEITNSTFAIAFATLKEAYAFAKNNAEKRNLTIKSELGFGEEQGEFIKDSLTDYRCEDKDGNSYYYIIYVQEL